MKLGIWELSIIFLLLFLDVMSIIDILRKRFTTNYKVAWIIVVIIFPFLGPALYFVFGKKNNQLK